MLISKSGRARCVRLFRRLGLILTPPMVRVARPTLSLAIHADRGLCWLRFLANQETNLIQYWFRVCLQHDSSTSFYCYMPENTFKLLTVLICGDYTDFRLKDKHQRSSQ